MNFRLLSIALVWLGLVLACASDRAAQGGEAKPPPDEAAQEQPADGGFDVDAALAREREPLPKRAIEFPEGKYTAEVEASAAPTVAAHENVFEVTVPLDPATGMRCFVYPEYVDPGTTLLSVLSSAGQNVNFQQVMPTSVEAQGIDPLVFAEGAYLVNDTLGLLKLGAYASDDVSLLCMHDEVGYRETFSRVLKGLAGSIKAAGEEAPEPEFGELHVVRIGDRDVGFERQRYYQKKGGGRIDDLAGMVLIPASQTELAHQGSIKSAATDAQGRIESISSYDLEQGQPKAQVDVERAPGGKNVYRYKGTVGGKEVEGTFKSKDPQGLPGDPVIERRFREEYFKKPNQTWTFEQYDPEIDPAKPIEITISGGDPQTRTAKIGIGGQQFTATLDPKGRVERVEADLGGAKLVQERIETVGAASGD